MASDIMNNDSSLLVVDDDRRLRELLQRFLGEHGFQVTLAADAVEARELLRERTFDLMILDVMMPGESGFDLTRAVKDDPTHPAYTMPILLLTAMNEGENRIEGLESGADDYLAKPFEPKELVLRIRKILQRIQVPQKPQKVIPLGDFQYHLERGELTRDNTLVTLTTAEQNLLSLLAENSGRPMSRDDLAAKTGVSLSPRTVDVQVTRLRRKIEPDPKQPLYLRTVRHKGYVLWPGTH